MPKVQPLRFDDHEVGEMIHAYITHGEGSPEYQAALSKCAQRLSDWIDQKVAEEVFAELYPSD